MLVVLDVELLKQGVLLRSGGAILIGKVFNPKIKY
jgi:hypothetical protein